MRPPLLHQRGGLLALLVVASASSRRRRQSRNYCVAVLVVSRAGVFVSVPLDEPVTHVCEDTTRSVVDEGTQCLHRRSGDGLHLSVAT